ncbi:AraC family transcriptional regulator [Aureitalea marina]|uniref:AraC family transcriptional regulator n=1 Tax=Aureitalea marina TaxID=930804 RepID=A0A2S7KU81_9FLAO|nr:AraC family transcriptional regulator [Aureitalea marina]
MYFSYNDKSSILLIFFFHAVVFSALLLKKGLEQNKKDCFWLASFIFLGGLYICPFMLGYADWYGEPGYRAFMFFFPFQQLFLIGPVFFFHTKTRLNSDFKFSRKDLLHFVPAIAYLIYTLIVFVVDKLILDEYYFYADQRDKDLAFWYQMAGLISMLFYLYLSLKYYSDYRKLSLAQVSFADEIAHKWIKHFAIAFGLILILRVLFFILNPEWGQFGSKYWYYLCFSILLMYISIAGYSSTLKSALNPKFKPGVKFSTSDSRSISEPITSSIEEVALDQWKDRITALFDQEEVFRNPNLTLTDVADKLNTNRNVVSKAINQEFKLNFNDYVNQKRAEAVIDQLKKGQHHRSTFLGLALDCGFNSKTTFNRAFKKYTGITPKQYISQNEL